MGSFQRMHRVSLWQVLGLVTLSFLNNPRPANAEPGLASNADKAMRYIQVPASNKEERTRIANLGMSIEAFRSDSVWGFASGRVIKRLRAAKIPIWGNFDYSIGRGGHEGMGALDFPSEDSRYHNYQRTTELLNQIHQKNPDITQVISIGKSLEGRDLWAIHINTSSDALSSNRSNKPGAIYMGNHHAREHLSNEIPLMFLQYLMEHRTDARIASLLDTRDIWIIPMVNPDGVEYDISTGKYQWWRKNRRANPDGSFGVDLNRNYGFMWNHGGSSEDTTSDIYMGPAPFSEPETQAIRDFVTAHASNTKVLLTFHTFSELILYPWGHTFDPIGKTLGKAEDKAVFEKMARTMAGWNHYTPEQASALYIASGDTVDWAYGQHGIFGFTFELSPKELMDGGFYPGASAVDTVFQDNLKPCLYLLDMAGNPYQVISESTTGLLHNYVEPRISSELMWETHPVTP